jgi:hypothetical protein
MLNYKDVCQSLTITGAVNSSTLNADGTATVYLDLVNETTGGGQNVTVDQISSSVAGVTVSSPTLPLALGDAPAGRGTNIILTLTAPAGVTTFSLTESGTVADRAGNVNNFTTT